ncbi:hypothetical protein [Psychrobacillus antarcticus]|nr:hypothetical protein [Psychrobacillus antarcticus]
MNKFKNRSVTTDNRSNLSENRLNRTDNRSNPRMKRLKDFGLP